LKIHKAHRIRGKRLRLPSYLLIENASQTHLTFSQLSCASRFRCRLAVNRPEPGNPPRMAQPAPRRDALNNFPGPIRVFVEDVLRPNCFGPARFVHSIAWAQYNPANATAFAQSRQRLERRASRLMSFVQTVEQLHGLQKKRFKRTSSEKVAGGRNSDGSTTNDTLCWRVRALPNQTPLCASQSGTLRGTRRPDPCFLEV
jgi:hypothetical protein